MKPLGALLLLSLTGLLVAAVAEQRINNPANPQHVPHPNGALLAVSFAHADHTDQNCVYCHHNYVDDTGSGMCFDCHKSDPEVAPVIETQFHDLCRGCHMEQLAKAEHHGPTRACISCHTRDHLP